MTDNLIKLVEVQPGSAAEKPLRFKLPESLSGKSIEDVIKYGTNDANLPRQGQRIAETIKTEMRGDYGITVNGAGVTGTELIDSYFIEQQKEGTNYLGVSIVVASKQTGGNSMY